MGRPLVTITGKTRTNVPVAKPCTVACMGRGVGILTSTKMVCIVVLIRAGKTCVCACLPVVAGECDECN